MTLLYGTFALVAHRELRELVSAAHPAQRDPIADDRDEFGG